MTITLDRDTVERLRASREPLDILDHTGTRLATVPVLDDPPVPPITEEEIEEAMRSRDAGGPTKPAAEVFDRVFGEGWRERHGVGQ